MLRFGNPSGNSPIFANASPNTSPFTGWGIFDRADGSIAFECGAGNSIRELVVSSRAVDNDPQFLVGRWDSQSGFLDGFRNGVRASTRTSASGSISYPNATDRGPAIGNFYDFTGSNRSYNGVVALTALWDVALTDQDIAELSANPWQLFAPRRIWVPVAAAASGTAAITPAAGSSSAQTRTGASAAAATITAAAGVSSAQTRTGASAAAATITVAAGASSAQTLAGSSTAAATITAAAGSSATATLAGSADTPGAAAIVAATAGSTADTLTGAATAAAAITPAAGSSATATLFSPGVPAASVIAQIAWWPTEPPEDMTQWRRWMKEQLEGAANAITLLADGHIDVSHRAPSKPRAGDLRIADGSNWNPGSGAGLYRYDGTAWVHLG